MRALMIRPWLLTKLAVIAALLAASPPLLAQATTTDAAGVSAVDELAFWNSVKESRNPDDLKRYLDGFPDGMFHDPAISRYEELTGKKQSLLTESGDSTQSGVSSETVAKKKATAASKSKKSATAQSKSKKSAVKKQKTKKKVAANTRKCTSGSSQGRCATKVVAKKKAAPVDMGGGGGGGGGSSGGGGWK